MEPYNRPDTPDDGPPPSSATSEVDIRDRSASPQTKLRQAQDACDRASENVEQQDEDNESDGSGRSGSTEVLGDKGYSPNDPEPQIYQARRASLPPISTGTGVTTDGDPACVKKIPVNFQSLNFPNKIGVVEHVSPSESPETSPVLPSTPSRASSPTARETPLRNLPTLLSERRRLTSPSVDTNVPNQALPKDHTLQTPSIDADNPNQVFMNDHNRHAPSVDTKVPNQGIPTNDSFQTPIRSSQDETQPAAQIPGENSHIPAALSTSADTLPDSPSQPLRRSPPSRILNPIPPRGRRRRSPGSRRRIPRFSVDSLGLRRNECAETPETTSSGDSHRRNESSHVRDAPFPRDSPSDNPGSPSLSTVASELSHRSLRRVNGAGSLNALRELAFLHRPPGVPSFNLAAITSHLPTSPPGSDSGEQEYVVEQSEGSGREERTGGNAIEPPPNTHEEDQESTSLDPHEDPDDPIGQDFIAGTAAMETALLHLKSTSDAAGFDDNHLGVAQTRENLQFAAGHFTNAIKRAALTAARERLEHRVLRDGTNELRRTRRTLEYGWMKSNTTIERLQKEIYDNMMATIQAETDANMAHVEADWLRATEKLDKARIRVLERNAEVRKRDLNKFARERDEMEGLLYGIDFPDPDY